MVVLDAVLEVQRSQAKDLAVRWNCKAAKCGSCSAEVNGLPRLMCKTRLDHLPRTSRSGRAAQSVPGDPRPRHRRLLELRGQQADPAVHAEETGPTPTGRSGRRTSTGCRSSASASSASCARTCATSCATTVCRRYFGPRFLVRIASLEMHPLDTLDRTDLLLEEGGLGLCNITKCCTEVCPEGSTSPTTPSSRSRSASSTAATTRSRSSCAGSPAAGLNEGSAGSAGGVAICGGWSL